jgi:sugar lactone lactonase YvrE
MSAMRFTDAGIPRSAHIPSANLKIRSLGEEFRGQIYGVLGAEAADDAADFSLRYVADVNKTAVAVNWDHKSSWDTNTWLISPDISDVVQEVINRGGWASGNALALIYSTRQDSGKSRWFSSFEAGAGAVVEINYETHTISGYTTTRDGNGLEGVAVSAGSDIEVKVTNSSGYYELHVPPNWSGTVTVNKGGWAFNPSNRVYTSVASDQTNQDYTAFQPTISGQVTDRDGPGVVGVEVSADNGGGSAITDPSGHYEIVVPYGWSGTVTASKSPWHFRPSSRSFTNVTSDQVDQNYVLFEPKLSGYVMDRYDNVIEGVSLLSDNGGGTGVTDANGYYKIRVPYDWSGTVRPNLPDWRMIPESRVYSNVVDDMNEQDYEAFRPLVSGYVRYSNGFGVGGAMLSAEPNGGYCITDPDGYYELTIPFGWTGVVTPSKTYHSFDPNLMSYSNVIEDYLEQDYLAGGVYGGGTGDPNDPFLIWTAEELNQIGLHPEDWNKHFALKADIDMSAYPSGQYHVIGRQVSVDTPYGITLDAGNQRIYWTDKGMDRLRSINTDTTQQDDVIISGLRDPVAIALDLPGGKVYWTEASSSPKIRRASLDGTVIEDLVTTGLDYPRGLALDLNSRKMYWTDQGTYTIKRANLDGNDINDITPPGIDHPIGLALDVVGGKIYWVDYGTDKIQRANLDGTNVEDLVTEGLITPGGLSLDIEDNKMYWTDWGTHKIQRADLDGNDVEDVITSGLGMPIDITLDPINDKLYWTDNGTHKIQRANIDGTSIEDLLPLPPFTGSFEGNGHSISNFTYIAPGADYVGIFRSISTPAEVNGVHLVNPYIDVGWGRMCGTLIGFRTGIGTVSNCSVVNAYVNGAEYVGGLTGMNYGTLRNCQVSGNINGELYTGGIVGYVSSIGSEIIGCSFTGNIIGGSQTGGLVGYNNDGSIEQCYANATVYGMTQTGGLVGYLRTSSYGEGLTNSFFAGDVNGTDSVGGLAGRQYGEVYSCYSDANVNGISKVGGLVGDSTGIVSGCYSAGRIGASEDFGGIAGFGDGENIFNSFWDIDTSGVLTSAGGVGLTTSEMQRASTYDVIWSCEVAQWTIDDGNDYPRLLWEDKPGEIIERYSYGGGSGSPDDPYLISTAEQLNTIGLLECDWIVNFRLTADIDMTDLGDVNFNSIDAYHGVFDGNGHTIQNLNLFENGMFGTLYSSAVVKNLQLYNAFLDANSASGVGILAGSNMGYIFACCGDVQVLNGGSTIGGLVGRNNSYGSIMNCYVGGHIQGQGSIGGLVGWNDGLVRNCYSAVNISGSQYLGGLIGNNSSDSKVDSSFWDVDVSGQPNGIGTGEPGDVTGKTTVEMQTSDTFINAGWDFAGETTNGPSDIWAELPGHPYMVLWWQLEPNDLPSLPTFSGGSGTRQDPYIVSTTSDIRSIGHNPRLMDSHFLLANNANLAGEDFYSIGNQAYRFSASFDGNRYEVSNLNIDRSWETCVGFFGCTDNNCVIENLGLVAVNITAEECRYVGGLAGLCNNTDITNCYVSGAVAGHNIGYGSIGVAGLVGRSVDSTLQRCFSEGTVSATGSYSYAGGLASSFYDSTAVDCFSTTFVTGYEQSGGLFSYCGLSRVEDCYASGLVEATHYNGKDGGLVAHNFNSEYQDCFWDIDTTGQSNALGNTTAIVATGATTAEMMTASTFVDAGWDFVNTWDVIETVTFPYLVGQPGPKPFKARLFDPKDGTEYVGIDVYLSFEPGVGATSHDIYFGTADPPPFVGNIADSFYEPGLLDSYTTYYWRIDAVGPFGITQGDTLSFGTSAWRGFGVEGDPFLIQNPDDLLALSTDPHAAGANFELSADIDMNDLQDGVYEPFRFAGVLDGNGHSISNFHHSGDGHEVGFFSNISGIVRNVTLIDPFVDGGSGDKIGALAGSASRGATIENCHVDNAVVSGSNYVGGLVGYGGIFSLYEKWAAIILNCSSSGVVTGNDYVGGITGIGRATNTRSYSMVSGRNYIGGLIGYAVSAVSNCRAEGAISGSDYVGGLIGKTYSVNYPTVSVENSCAIGDVTGQTWVGGLIGLQSERISNCYARCDVDGVANVGGLCGACGSLMVNCYSTGEVTGITDAGGLTGLGGAKSFSCFWDIQTSGQTSSGVGKGLTTDLMKSEVTYAGFGCDELWTIDDGNEYPYLLWENRPGQLVAKPTYGGGTGTTDDPYLIYTAEQMSIIGLVLCDYDKHFKLMADIDMSYYDGIDGRPNYNIPGTAYMESGSGRTQAFSGVFDGCYHTISNLCLNNTGERYVGCFGYVDGDVGSTGEGLAEVKNLGLVDPNIVDTSFTGNDKAIGSLMGSLRYGTVSSCYVLSGSINATTDPQSNREAYVGGLVGMNSYNGSIIRSFSSCSVAGTGQWCYAGGLAGYNWRTAEILDCYSNSSVEGYQGKTGGLVGENYEATIRNCYSTGPVTVGTGYKGRGLVGYNGGFFHEGIIEESFWDIQSSGCTSSAGGAGLTTEEMQDPNTFISAGWDFVGEEANGAEDVWTIKGGTDYPKLIWDMVGFVGGGGINGRDFAYLASWWNEGDCDLNDDCSGTDLNLSAVVDWRDLKIFCDYWLGGSGP